MKGEVSVEVEEFHDHMTQLPSREIMRKFIVITVFFLASQSVFACFPAQDPLQTQLENADAIFIADLSQSITDTSGKRAGCGAHYVLSHVVALKIIKGDQMPSMVRWPEYQSAHRTGRALVIMKIEDGVNYAAVAFESDEPELFAAGEKGDFSKLLDQGAD